jgi:hypothetical protein
MLDRKKRVLGFLGRRGLGLDDLSWAWASGLASWLTWGRQNTDIYRWTTRTGRREETHGVEKPKFMVFVNGRFRGCAGWTLEKGGQW